MRKKVKTTSLTKGSFITRLGLKAALLASFVVGCVSSHDYYGTVVERSKVVPPMWVDLAPGVFHEREERLAFVSVKQRISDLPLGIKQAQFYALSHSKNKLHLKIRQTIMEMAGEASLKKASLRAFEAALKKVLAKEHKKHIKIVDMYFETYQKKKAGPSSMVEESTVYVLSYFPLGGVKRILKSLALEFSKSSNKELSKLSLVLSQGMK